MNFGEYIAERKATIASKGIAHSTARAHECDGSKDHADQRKHDQAHTSSTALGGINKNSEERTFCSIDNVFDIADAE